MRSTTPLALALALAIAGPALAQDVQTPALEGRYQVQVTSSSARRTIAPEAELDVSSNGRIRLKLDGKRVRLARVGDSLYGRLAEVKPGIIASLSGGAGLPSATLRLRIVSADELSGTIFSNQENTRLTLRRVGAPDAALVEKVRRWVMANAGDEDDKLFPHVDSGEEGLQAYILTGAPADRLVAFAKAMNSHDAALQGLEVDHARQVVVAVQETFDEEDLYVVVMDRATGAARLLGGSKLYIVDFYSTLDQATFDRLVPGMGSMEDVDHYDLVEKLVEGGEGVDLTADGFAARYWSRDDRAVKFFRDEEEWREWYDSGTPTGRWIQLDENESEYATYVLGSDDTWIEKIKVTRATGAIEVVGEH